MFSISIIEDSEGRSLSWSKLQSADEISVGRFFEYDSDALLMFNKWLEFIKDSNTEVLEVGSGPGFFTDLIFKLNPEVCLTCLEPDESFIKILEERFGNSIQLLQNKIEDALELAGKFDAAITHIVVHNLPNPTTILEKMKECVRIGGHVVTVEPLPQAKHFYPSETISEAFNLLDKVKVLRWQQRIESLDFANEWDPWDRCYAQLFEEVGLKNIHSYGWTSVFTLSDNRYSYREREEWIAMRSKLIENEKKRRTQELLKLGVEKSAIESAYSVVFRYLDELENKTKEQLSCLHEQEIVHRVITIGER